MAKKTRPVEWANKVSQQVADEMNFELLEAAFEKEPAGLYLRIYLDREGGINLDDCERFHRAVMPLLDSIDYDFLEVCSAGLDRPIKNARDAQKAIGTEIEVKLFKPRDGQKEFMGTLLAYSEEGLTLSTANSELVFPLKDLALARRTVDLSILDEEEVLSQEEAE